MDNLLPITEAISRYHLSDAELHTLIDKGKIQVMNYSDILLISESQLKMNLPKHDRPEFKQFENLKGVGIHLSAAARKYNIPHPTIYRWTTAGYISILGREGNKVLLDESEVAYCAYIYKEKKGSQGKWVFTEDGTPYTPKGRK